MFTGIISDVGRVTAVAPGGVTRITIATAYQPETIDLGASIACSGACMTVVERGRDAADIGWFAVEVSRESLERTTLGRWASGTPVNLERSLRIGDELGGHIVTGHVDGLATVVERMTDGASERFRFAVPLTLARFIAEKGSVALDGVSLTVNDVTDDQFGVNIIPHTLNHTTFGALWPHMQVNLEVDLMARYAARLLTAA